MPAALHPSCSICLVLSGPPLWLVRQILPILWHLANPLFFMHKYHLSFYFCWPAALLLPTLYSSPERALYTSGRLNAISVTPLGKTVISRFSNLGVDIVLCSLLDKAAGVVPESVQHYSKKFRKDAYEIMVHTGKIKRAFMLSAFCFYWD